LILSYSFRKKHNCYDELREAEYLLITSYSFRWLRIGSLHCVSIIVLRKKRGEIPELKYYNIKTYWECRFSSIHS